MLEEKYHPVREVVGEPGRIEMLFYRFPEYPKDIMHVNFNLV